MTRLGGDSSSDKAQNSKDGPAQPDLEKAQKNPIKYQSFQIGSCAYFKLCFIQYFPSFLSDCCKSKKELAWDKATDKIAEETSYINIIRQLRESQEAMKLLLTKSQYKKIK